jgi:hypothetical protein
MHIRRIASWAVVALSLGAGSARAASPILGWVDRHDGGNQFNDDGWCVATDPAGNVVVAGESADGVGGIDLCVRKLARAGGQQLWQARYEGYDAKDVTVSDITWDLAGQLLVAGFIRGCVG